MNAFLETMKELVQRSYDRYIPMESEDDEGMWENFAPVWMSDVKKANTIASPLLLKIISGNIRSDKDDENETWADTASASAGSFIRTRRFVNTRATAQRFKNHVASGAITRTWRIPYLNSDGDRKELKVLIHEPSFSGIDVGLKTWGAAPFLAQ